MRVEQEVGKSNTDKATIWLGQILKIVLRIL
jgi:hypothetical protein